MASLFSEKYKLLFQHHPVELINASISAWIEFKETIPLQQQIQSPPVHSSWSPTIPGQCKINVDAACSASGF